MKKYILPLLVLVVAAIVVAYALNGGFSKVEIEQKTSEQKWIAGRAYSGPSRSNEIGEVYKQAGELVETGKLKGNLGGIYYNNPSEAKGKLEAFIGVVMPDTTADLPANYTWRKLPAGRQVLQARVKANYALIPGKAYPALFDYARDNNLTLKEEFFEEFLSKEEGVVTVPVTARR